MSSSKQIVGRGALYLYIETLISMIAGYLFWLIMSKITTSETIGTASAIISFVVIITSIGTIGISNGVQRFLGVQFSEQNTMEARRIVGISLVLVSISIAITSVIIYALRSWMSDVFDIDYNFVLTGILLIGTAIVTGLFRSIVIASLRTKALAIGMITGTTIKLIFSIVIILIGYGAIGILLGFAINNILLSVFLGLTILLILKKPPDKLSKGLPFLRISRDLIIASAASWIPLLITTIGSQMGTIVVFHSQDAGHAGIYFIAFSVLNAVTGIMYTLLTIAYPVLSSMQDGRKRFAWRMIKITVVVSLPLSFSFIWYSDEILSLLGSEYVEGSSALEILLVSILPTAIMTGVNQLVYAYGNYRYVLALGLASGIPRTILYFVFVPIYGGFGAALAYTIGSVVGFIAAIILANRIKMKLIWKDLGFILLVSGGISFIFSYLQVNYILGIPFTLAICYFLLLRLKILTKFEVQDSLLIFPARISRPISRLIDKIA